MLTLVLACSLSGAAAPISVPALTLQRPAELVALDPSAPGVAGYRVTSHRFGAVEVVRATPVVTLRVDGRPEAVPLVGADRLMRRYADRVELVRAPLVPASPAFRLTRAEAQVAAVRAVAASLLTEAQAGVSRGLARPVVAVRGEHAAAIFIVRVPTLRLEDLRDVWIDATTGEVVRQAPTARFAAPTAAKIFDPAPNPAAASVSDLRDAQLGDLVPAAPGGNLVGFHFATSNCCKRYTCPGSATSCAPEERACAGDDAAGAIISTADVGVPASMLPVAPTNGSSTLYVRTVVCTEGPRLTSAAGLTPGWFPTPVDVPREVNNAAGLASETDEFAELQAYWAEQTYFEHLRATLGDETFCLRDASMRCDEQGQALLGTSGAPVQPFHVRVNFLLPAVDTRDVGIQMLLQNRGGTADNPVIVSDFGRLGNAAFVPAMEGSPLEVPKELEALVTLFNRPYDSNLFGQGARDFAYDGDVVFHEFTHAVVGTLVPGLLSSGFDAWGSHVEPGAMNEGWSDYFAASYTDSSMVGEYAGTSLGGAGETAIRDVANQARCPDDLQGEVHQDSIPWSGALWDLRSAVIAELGAAGVSALDRLLLQAVAEADDAETFAAQASRVLALFDADLASPSPTFTLELREAAQQAFADHNVLACERVINLVTSTVGDPNPSPGWGPLVAPGPSEAGLSGLAPAPVQLAIALPPGVGGLTLSWQQSGAGGYGLAPAAPKPLAVVVHEDAPIAWAYVGPSGNRPEPRDPSGEVLPFDPASPASQAVLGPVSSSGVAPATFTFARAPDCRPHVVYASLVATGEGARLDAISARLDAPVLDCAVLPESDSDEDDGCRSVPAGAAPFLALLALWRRRHHGAARMRSI